MASGRERFVERIRRLHEKLVELGTEEHYRDTALYDHEYADRTEDIDWYRAFVAERATSGGVVVELGAGTGRIACPLAQDGFQVIAVDRMAAMLEGLAARTTALHLEASVHPLQADMRSLPLPDGSADLVIAPFNGLMHLYTWQDLLACFREVARVLRTGGWFAFDVQLPDLEWLTWDPEERHAVTRFVHPTTGERLVYSTNHTYDAETQVCHIRIYYDEAPPRGRKFSPPPSPKRLVHLAHRQIFPEELRMLVHVAGLELTSLTADFAGLPLREGSDSQVAVCAKPPRGPSPS